MYDPEWNSPDSELTAYQQYEEDQDTDYNPSNPKTHPVKEPVWKDNIWLDDCDLDVDED